ncbi:beta-hydroxyacyl-ACP dehydratase [Chromobacterium haemolyticum]|uniref:Beta-hydroxyacyl-ACP dehydratase n=1 Tax=Chromobacterium fluminis TaxID=3044269 RepID=A0ABX0L9B4_9NEIS|nr:beta-hydroxyacyl-ACP dehydratase [Chromobacterium haemolyticum]NHR05698.1 beta-hydroxyacyl-ACP dehydratase [Chromobacterium haemolyticum]
MTPSQAFTPPYSVLEQTEDACRVSIPLAADAACFDGHFPGFPVLPGVVQLHWAARIAARTLGSAGVFAGMDQIKFTGIVRPGDALELVLQLDAANGRLNFVYEVAGRKMSSGRLRMQAQ